MQQYFRAPECTKRTDVRETVTFPNWMLPTPLPTLVHISMVNKATLQQLTHGANYKARRRAARWHSFWPERLTQGRSACDGTLSAQKGRFKRQPLRLDPLSSLNSRALDHWSLAIRAFFLLNPTFTAREEQNSCRKRKRDTYKKIIRK